MLPNSSSSGLNPPINLVMQTPGYAGGHLTSRKMMALAWSNKLSVGNAVIDSEHRNLIVMVNSIEATFKSRDISALSQELEQVEYWLCAHFQNRKGLRRRLALTFPVSWSTRTC
jgi:hypothetical protein